VKATETAEEKEVPESGSSLIWTDEDGNVHMGQQAPEGAKTKKAEEIEFMIQN